LSADNATAEDAVGKAFASGILHVHAAFDYFNLPGVGAGIAAGIGRGRSREDLFITAMTSPCVHPAAPPQRNVTDPAACTALTSLEVTM
jgi:diketogulonate reductase-like aldo/keto reductase